MGEKLYIDSLAFFEVIVKPAFQDLLPINGYNVIDMLSEFTLMDGIASSRPIIDILRKQNILQRRDASCDLNYSKLFSTSTRKIYTDEVYAAVKLCRNELYQGCLRDWRANRAAFEDKIQPYFQSAVMTDMATNAYFGDTSRVVLPSATWSTNKFDGVFKWLKLYTTSGVIPSSQTIAIADGTDYTASATAAYTLIKAMYDKQSPLLRAQLATQKAFYVSQEISDAYGDYLTQTGTNANGWTDIANGIKVLAYKGIPVLVKNLFTPVITEMKGSAGFAAILTLQGNFVFATDSSYGEGPEGKDALIINYDEDDMVWRYRVFLKAGTQIALPEHVIYALSSFQ